MKVAWKVSMGEFLCDKGNKIINILEREKRKFKNHVVYFLKRTMTKSGYL